MTPPTPSIPPSPLAALGITILAWLCTLLVTGGLAGETGVMLALALGMTLGFGGVGTFVARQVPEPADRRLGLTAIGPAQVGIVLLLIPVVLLTSELDNWVAELVPRPEAVEGEPEVTDPEALALRALESALFIALLRPVIEEFFFRGVIQQGVVAALGPVSGVVLQASLFALVRATLGASDAYFVSTNAAQGFVEGALLGFLRLGTGSILAGIVLQVITGTIAMFLALRPDVLSIPGFTDTGSHTPLLWLVPAALCVALALGATFRSYQSQEPLPDPPPEPEEDDGPPTFF